MQRERRAKANHNPLLCSRVSLASRRMLSSVLRYSIRILLFLLWTYLVFQLALHVNINDHHEQTAPSSSFRENRTNSSFPLLAKSVEKKCLIKPPVELTLDYNNIYWQEFSSSNGTFYLYNAYYDNRTMGGPIPLVRILSMIDRLIPPPLYCQLWVHNSPVPLISRAVYRYIWHAKWGNFRDAILQPFVINCPVPSPKRRSSRPPPRIQSVSLFETNCTEVKNNLLVRENRPLNGKKQRFAVCVKGLEFLHEDLSFRLVEWIELLKILGANKIFFYQFDLHPRLQQVLQHYQQEKFVDVQTLSLPGSQPNLPEIRKDYLKKQIFFRRQNELIPYNDCLYRNIYLYDYVTLLDIDEIILPIKHFSWQQMFEHLQSKISTKSLNFSAISARNVYFLQPLNESNSTLLADQLNIPKYLHMLRNIDRSLAYTKPGAYVKTFFNTELIVAVHNHFPMICFGRCYRLEMDTSIAHLQHYRDDCVKELRKSCDAQYRLNTTRDKTIWKYRDQLVEQSSRTLRKLHFIS